MKTLIRSAPLAATVAVVLLLYGGGHASDSLAAATANAATRCPEGFTVTVHGLPAGSQPTSSLSDSCVLELGIPAGATGAPGTAGLAGAPGTEGPAGTDGVSGYTQRTTIIRSKSNITNNRLAGTTKCPAGKKAIGGGAEITSGGKLIVEGITTSLPTPNGQGWTARAAVKFSRDRVVLKVTAVCAAVS
jgi:hypothetical protein